MGAADLTTVIVVGALVGLFIVALGYAQMVWLARQGTGRDPAPARQSSPHRTWLLWAFAVLATACFLRAVTAGTLPDHQGFLVGEDLFSVRPRPGLVAKYETNSASVHRDEVLIRFTGQDGEEAHLAVQSRRKLLEGELEIERSRPLELDPELVRRAEEATATLRDREQRLKQLVSERDAIMREATQQRLAIANRQFRLEQDDRTAARELEPLRASLETEKRALGSQEELLAKGLLSQVSAARERDALTELEGRVGQLEDQRAIFAREKQEIANLSGLSEKTLAQQLGDRTAELSGLNTDIGTARKNLELATAALDQDRPRAEAVREKRLRQISVQIEECDSLLGRGRQATVEAPWDGRIGFREPSPSSVPADNGPLLVLYRPGSIGATVRLEPDETSAADADLRAEVQVVSSSDRVEGAGRGEESLPGKIVQRTLRPGGAGEIRVACDPPDRVVRRLAMGGSVPVMVRLRRSITGATSFRLGLAFGGLALALALYGALRRGTPRGSAEEPPRSDPRARDHDGLDPTAPSSPGAPQPLQVLPLQAPRVRLTALGELAILPAVYAALRRRLLHGVTVAEPSELEPRASRHDGLDPAAASGSPGGSGPAHGLPSQPPQLALPGLTAPGDAPPDGVLRRDDLASLAGLGAKLRMQVEAGVLAPGLVRRVSDVLTRSGYRAAALLGAGFGDIDDKQSIERAAFGLLAAARAGALGDATRDCAQFLRIMRAIGSERMNGTLDRLRVELIVAALDAAERGGSSSEMAAHVVKPLVEA